MSAAPHPRRDWPWKRVSAALAVCLVVTACLLALVLWPGPARSVELTGMEFHSINETSQIYEFDSGQFVPPPSRCVGSSTFLCSDLWVAFNWSTRNGEPLTFQFIDESGGTNNRVVYASSNLSFGGDSFSCTPPPVDCGGPLLISTNDTSGQAWNFDWVEVFNYTATQTSAPWL